jgi:hypothetical protein
LKIYAVLIPSMESIIEIVEMITRIIKNIYVFFIMIMYPQIKTLCRI